MHLESMRTVLLSSLLFISGIADAQLNLPEEPQIIGMIAKSVLGVKNNKVFIYKENATAWQSYFELPFTPDSGTTRVASEKSVSFIVADTVYFTDLSGKKIKQLAKNQLLQDFLKSGLQQLSFEDGTMGCFHHEKNELSYTYRNGQWGNPEIQKTGRQRLPGWKSTIDPAVVQEFVESLNGIMQHPFDIALNDLGFREADYRAYKKEIKKQRAAQTFFFPFQEKDFDRVSLLVDSIKTMPPEALAKALLADEGFYSTNSTWKSIIITNQAKQKISIQYTNSTGSNTYSPWTVDLNGYSFTTTSMAITGFLNEVYPGFINPGETKMALMTKIIRSLL
ncbi:MAG: hypothetical protein BGO56_11510 [Sphingobacteriales bacterium 48-107]|nr:MAG: hypothetical protein BGO56_11510 [Sphingobacteriales bacterium 48-107]